MVIMTFDLSSTCIGVIASEIDKYGNVLKISSCPIIPKEFDPRTLGYMKSKKKLPLKNKDEQLNTYYRQGEKYITKTEKSRRDKEVRYKKDIHILQSISKTINELVSAISPDLILVEKNEIFNGVLTSVLLGKVMGTLVAISGINGIDLEEFKVTEVRSIFDIKEVLVDFKNNYQGNLEDVPDVTKRALRVLMEDIYDIKFQTDDESDACVVFHYWLNKKYRQRAQRRG